MEEKRTDAPFRAKICIGHWEVLSTWAARCPKCNKHFRLLWPFWVLQIPLHRVVDLRCPTCRYPFSLVAVSLTACDGDERLATGLVQGIS
jgi:hypothetical protein